MATRVAGEKACRKNLTARLVNSVIGILFIVVFIFSVICFSAFLYKSNEINDTVYGVNNTFGRCILYADNVGNDSSPWPRIHLGRSNICLFVIYGELVMCVYSLAFTFAMFFKVVCGCSLMRCDLIVELIANTCVTVLQCLIAVVLSSGLRDTCNAAREIEDDEEDNSCVDYTIPEENGDEKTLTFYRHINASEVTAWLSFIVLVFIVVYYIITITLCVHGKVKAKTEKHKTLVEEDEKPNPETELQETAQ